MKLDEIIRNYTHYLTDENQNKWKVIETSDIEEICKEYHKKKLNLCGAQQYLERIENKKLNSTPLYSRKEMIGFAEKYAKQLTTPVVVLQGKQFSISDIYKIAQNYTEEQFIEMIQHVQG